MDSRDTILPELHVEEAITEVVGFIRRITFGYRSTYILGLSGGVDSTTVAYLLSKSIKKDRIRAIIMPYHQSDKKNIEDALLIADKLQIYHQIIDISLVIDEYFSHFPDADQFRRGNKIARERMAVLYDMSALHKGLVIGTGNKSELFLGYFTKYGDGGVDIEPLGALYKTYIYQMARYLGVPESIINKHPTADLWPGQMDEEELGIEYRIADQILYLMIDKGEDSEKIIEKGFSRKLVTRVAELVNVSRHKRALPPVPDTRYIFNV